MNWTIRFCWLFKPFAHLFVCGTGSFLGVVRPRPSPRFLEVVDALEHTELSDGALMVSWTCQVESRGVDGDGEKGPSESPKDRSNWVVATQIFLIFIPRP